MSCPIEEIDPIFSRRELVSNAAAITTKAVKTFGVFTLLLGAAGFRSAIRSQAIDGSTPTPRDLYNVIGKDDIKLLASGGVTTLGGGFTDIGVTCMLKNEELGEQLISRRPLLKAGVVFSAAIAGLAVGVMTTEGHAEQDVKRLVRRIF